MVCRYLFVRCDNSPPPWSTSDAGDEQRLEVPEEAARELAGADRGQVL